MAGIAMFNKIFLLIFLFSSTANAIEWEDPDCGKFNIREGKVFDININMSFHGSIEIKLCKKPDQHFLVVHKKLNPPETKKEKIDSRKLALNSEQIEKLMEAYKKAMKYNTLDGSSGLDGSSWCITSQNGFTYTKGCFWSPEYKSEERGLKGLYDLGMYLWEITGLNKENVELY